MRFLLAITFLVFSVCASLAQTPPADGFDLEAFAATAIRAEEVIEKGAASDSALESLRGQLSAFRSAALKEQQKHADRIATISERLAALGPAPDNGATEAEDMAALRGELQEALNEAKAPSVAADEAYRRANGLIREIDLLVRARTAEELLHLGPSPLNPAHWAQTAKVLTNYASLISKEALGNWDNVSRKVERLDKLPVVAFMFALGLLLMVRARHWSRQFLALINKNASLRLSAFYSFLTSLAQLILPIIGLGLLVGAVDLLELFDLRGQFLLKACGIAGFSLYFGSWLSRSLLLPIGRQQAFIHVEPERQTTLRWVVIILALVFALNSMVYALDSGHDLPEHVLAVLRFPLLLLGGWTLVRLGKEIAEVARYSGGSTDATPFLARVGILISRFSMAAGVFGPILSAIGYGQAGSRLIFATALSLVLITTFYIFFRLIGLLTGQISRSVIAAGSEPEQKRYGALFQIALGFAFISLAIPLLALIWGARVSELQEVWLYLREGMVLGETRISITDFLTFVLIFSLGYTITRLLQSALRSIILPNTKLDTGGQNAIVTGTGYVGIFLAALAAISATALDLSNLAIVAGALSVGIGFGLQAIVSNFVSGIILLIERPIKEGDWIDVGAHSGIVKNISVRSTMIQTFDRATLIIPNADLISTTVTNWTHKSLSGRVKVGVGVSYDSDPRQVKAILLEIAEAHPMVLRDPAPSVVFIGFGPDSLDFEIRAILRDINWMLSARSDMNFEIMRRFTEAGIEIPFAQRDIKLKNMDELAAILKEAREE